MPKRYHVGVRHPVTHYEYYGGAYLWQEWSWHQMGRSAFNKRLETNLIQYA